MERYRYIKSNASDITYLSELIPTNALKLWNRILARFMSRDRSDKVCPLPKHPENLFDIFGIGFGLNSQTASPTTYVAKDLSEGSVSCLLI